MYQFIKKKKQIKNENRIGDVAEWDTLRILLSLVGSVHTVGQRRRRVVTLALAPSLGAPGGTVLLRRHLVVPVGAIRNVAILPTATSLRIASFAHRVVRAIRLADVYGGDGGDGGGDGGFVVVATERVAGFAVAVRGQRGRDYFVGVETTIVDNQFNWAVHADISVLDWLRGGERRTRMRVGGEGEIMGGGEKQYNEGRWWRRDNGGER